MKDRLYLRTAYILSVLSIFLPWFTYNPKVMGYCWGYRFLPWMAVPLVITALYVFSREQKLPLAILAELGAAANLGILVVVLGSWQEFANIIDGFQWKDSLHTATVGYWISAMLFLTQFVLLQVNVCNKNRSGN